MDDRHLSWLAGDIERAKSNLAGVTKEHKELLRENQRLKDEISRVHRARTEAVSELRRRQQLQGRSEPPNLGTLKFKRLRHEAPLPTRATEGSAGLDIYALIDGTVEFNCHCHVYTGWAVEIPPGFEGQLRSRSGKMLKVSGGVSTIDSDYRGEVVVPLVNQFSVTGSHFRAGDRIAQLVICPIATPKPMFVDELGPTTRNKGGFGSTGE